MRGRKVVCVVRRGMVVSAGRRDRSGCSGGGGGNLGQVGDVAGAQVIGSGGQVWVASGLGGGGWEGANVGMGVLRVQRGKHNGGGGWIS